MKIFTQGLRSKMVTNSLVLIVAFLGFSQFSIAQPWIYDFGTGTGTFTNTTASTSFLPTPPSGGGTTYVRTGNATPTAGTVALVNAGIALGTATELQFTSNSGSASTSKVSVLGYTGGKIGYVKFNIAFNGGTNGIYLFSLGSGANFSTNSPIGTSEIFAGIQWTFGASNAITYNVLSGTTYVSTNITNATTLFTQSTSNNYLVEVYANNSTAATSYVRAGSSFTLAIGTWDLWVNGTRVGTGLPKGAFAANTNFNSYSFYHQSSASAPGTLYIDDIEYSNTLPTNAAPVASSVSISGTATEGQTLTGSYTYSDAESNPESGTTFKWYRANDAAGTGETAIAGATSSTYVLTSADVAKYIRFGVTPGSSAGTSPGVEAFSSPRVGPVAALTPALSITANTTNNHGTTCPGTSTAPLTYTVTNNGAVSAANITLAKSGTDAADFAITTNIPAGTTLGAGGSTTFIVTFTPGSGGSKTATITANSTTSGTTTTGLALTGTGTTPVSASITTSAPSSVVNTTATLNGNVSTLGVCPTTTAKGFVYAKTSDSPTPADGGTGVITSAAVTPLGTGLYSLNLTGLLPVTSYSYRAYLFDGTTYTYGAVQTFTTLAAADHLAFGTLPPTSGSVGTNLTTFTVQARRPDNSVDAEYTGAVNLTRNIVIGSGNLAGTISVNAVAGVATFSAVQFDAAGTYTINAASGVFTTITSANIVISLSNAPIILWSSAGGSAWLTGANWTGGSVPSSAQVAQFAVNPTPGTSVNINGGTTTAGAIEVTNGRSLALTIGNNSGSATNGIITLTGVVVNGTSNVILRNNSSSTLTIQNTGSTGSGSNTTAVALGNAANNVIDISGSGDIAISSIITGANPLTKTGTGSGVLQLTGANTYTGLTTVTGGTLQLNRTGGTTIPATNSITINGGTLKVTTSQTLANLTMSSGSLVIDAGATLTVTGSYNVTGGTINSLGTINLSGSGYSFPGTGVTVNNGTTNTIAALTITSSGTVSMSGDFTVAGALTLTSGVLAINGQTLTLGGAVTRTAGNLAGGNTSNVIVAGTAGSLYFDATGTNNYLKLLTINNGATATLGNALNITAWDGTTNPDSTGVLTVAGTGVLTTGGFLTIKSSATGTARIAPNTSGANYIVGDVTVERFIRANSSKGWRLLASNTSGQTINAAWQEGQANSASNTTPGFGIQISAGNTITTVLANARTLGFDTLSAGTALFKYNPATDGLVAVANTNATGLASEPGYFVFIRGDRRLGGYGAGTVPTASTVLRSKGQLFLGSYTATTGAFNFGLARNPFPSRIDMRQIVKGGALVDAFQVWDPTIGGAYGVGGYQTFTRSGNDYITTSAAGSYGGSGVVNNYIESGEAFYIQSSGGVGTAQITESSKASGSNNFVFRPSSPLAGQQRASFNLYANNSGTFDAVDGGLVFFDNAYSNAVDINDVRKSGNFSENFGLVRENISLVVERRSLINTTDTLFFDMNNLRQIPYRLDIQISDIDPLITAATLEDKYTNTSTALDLTTTNAYAFIVDANAASKAADRFSVVFRQSSVVPVNFVSVKATQSANNIAVEWKVANEINVKSYAIEKSTDGINFTQKGTVSAAGIPVYNWLDAGVVNGYNYYRIKSVDNSGQFKYSEVVRVQIGGKAGISVSPNPGKGNSVNIQFNEQTAGKYGVRITNIAGQVVYNSEFKHNGGSASQSFVLSSALKAGIYQLEVVAPDNTTHIERLVINQGN